MINANIRKTHKSPAKRRPSTKDNAFLQYNGSCRDYEDLADYLPRMSLKGAVIA
ncbi:hypothetical protein LOZ80_15205 [Paenibacillus sp. HWE-109]|uniref:hypothetical protein n=1 Tax=Paenibacillus sp. HWE-109 TaxID=1306526 RepID=UPI001EE08923|nr:hypothetical protein [Paenibacillus sp. HWE-109]UKS30208.1 hypothetical protein LOZ80_15205 [Paenibacillus sp. HWE-109]